MDARPLGGSTRALPRKEVTTPTLRARQVRSGPSVSLFVRHDNPASTKRRYVGYGRYWLHLWQPADILCSAASDLV